MPIYLGTKCNRIGIFFAGAPVVFLVPAIAMAEPAPGVTNWATWVIPTEYEFALQETTGLGYSYAPGTTGTVVDPVTGQALNLTLSGEVLNTSTDLFSWPTYGSVSSAYTSDVSPTEITNADVIGATGDTLDQYRAHTLSFGQNVENAVMPIYSLGSPTDEGQLTFSQPFVVLSDNGRLTPGADETNGYRLSGSEGSGVIQFLGTYDKISWVVTDVEVWHGMTVGLTTPDNPEAGNTEIVPYDLFAEGTGVTAPTPFAGSEPDPTPEPELTAPPMSVLERVLAQIDGATNLATVNGTFVNIAENLGGADGAGIDGSITNIVTGVTEATERAAALAGVSAMEMAIPTVDFGDMATTALGAVNTGEIALGVNSSVDEAATRTSRAVSAAMTQLGGDAEVGALVLNIASNVTSVDGSISNTLLMVNGTVGNISTTALGAVNTGTITSGVSAAVQGIVGMGG